MVQHTHTEFLLHSQPIHSPFLPQTHLVFFAIKVTPTPKLLRAMSNTPSWRDLHTDAPLDTGYPLSDFLSAVQQTMESWDKLDRFSRRYGPDDSCVFGTDTFRGHGRQVHQGHPRLRNLHKAHLKLTQTSCILYYSSTVFWLHVSSIQVLLYK